MLDEHQQQAAAPRRLVFRQPGKGGAPVDRVFVSGPFSGWKPVHERFRLTPLPDGRGWTINIAFPPGRTPYKFVVFHKGAAKPVWIHDHANPETVDDGFSGKNSVAVVSDNGHLSSLIRWISGGLAVLLAFYLLVELVLRVLFRTRLSAAQRALSAFCLILVLAGGVSLRFHVEQQRALTRAAYVELANLIALFLDGQGIDLTRLGPASTPALTRALDVFFRRARARTEQRWHADLSSTVHRIVIFGPDKQALAVGDRDEFPVAFPNRLDHATLRRHYCREVFKGMFDRLRKVPPGVLTDVLNEGRGTAGSGTFFLASDRLGYNLVLCPVVQDLLPAGWIGMIVLPQQYADSLGETIFIHIAGLVFLLGFSIIIFFLQPLEPVVTPEALGAFVSRHGLTKREAEVIAYLVRGMDYATIADTLFVSLKTVKTHVYNVYKKARVKNRISLIEAVRQYR